MADEAPILCSEHDRRLPREMYVKLIVVHFVVIASYGHLNHLRRERRGPFIYALLITCPAAGIALILIPFLSLIVQAIIYRGNKNVLRYSLALLIGRLPRPDGELGQESALFRWPKFSTRFVQTVVMQVVPLIQSILSLWLYYRRVRNGSAALYDRTIAQLAILGLSASFASIVHLLVDPCCPSVLPSLEAAGRRWNWTAVLRPTLDIRTATTPRLPRSLLILIMEWTYVNFSYLLCGMTGIVESYYLTSDLLNHRMILFDYIGSILGYPNAFIYPSLILLGFALITFRDHMPPFSRRNYMQYIKIVAAVVALYLFLVFVLLPGGIFLGALSIDFLYIPTGGVRRDMHLLSRPFQDFRDLAKYGVDWDQIWAYGHAPTSIPCPKAWKDPAADYIWWLA